jgi:hypothetical protein
VVNLPLIAGSLKPRSSLVLAADNDPPARIDRSLTKVERTASRFLADLIVAEGKPLPPGGGFPSPVDGQSLLGVPIKRWGEECETRQLSTAETRKSRSFIFRRTFQNLLDKNAVAARDELVWLT